MKLEHMPKYLFKYRSFCNNHLSALYQGILYFTATDKLNDVKEANIVISEQAQKRVYQTLYDNIRKKYGFPKAEITCFIELIKAIEHHFKQFAGKNADIDFTTTEEFKTIIKIHDAFQKSQLDSLQEEVRAMYSVCCFSAFNDVNQMWAHYGEDHRGFCIEYGFKELGEESLYTSLLFPVLYCEDNRVFINDVDQINGNIGLLAATLKEKKEWETEAEWRLVHEIKEHGTSQLMPKPTAIYLGTRTNVDNINNMEEYCKSKDIPLFKMRYNQQNNKIEPVLLYSP